LSPESTSTLWVCPKQPKPGAESVVRQLIHGDQQTKRRLSSIESSFTHRQHQPLKTQLIRIVADDTASTTSPRRRPPDLYQTLMRPGQDGSTPINRNLKRVMHQLKKWYNYKDPFSKKRGGQPLSDRHQLTKLDFMSERVGSRMMSDGTFLTQDDYDEMLGIIEEALSPHASCDEDSSDSDDFFIREDDEHQIMIKIRQTINQYKPEMKMKFLFKCLNMLLIHKGDSFVAKRHSKYLAQMRKGQREKNFYERMQEDVR